MRSQDGEATFTIHIVVKYSKDKYKTKGIKYFTYATYGMDLPISKTFKEYRKTFWNRIQLQTNEPSTSTHQHQKTRPTTAICRIRPPPGQHLDLHPNGHVSAYPEEEAANHEPGPSKPC